MPTRLPVLLQRRKSALAHRADANTNTAAIPAITAVQRLAAIKGKRLTIRRFGVARLSRDLSRAVNDDGAEVGHIGEGVSGNQQVAQPTEKPCGIVVGEKGGRIEAESIGASGRAAVGKSAGRIACRSTSAVGPVGIGCERCDRGHAGKRDGERERIFLIGPAAALATNGDGQLTARQDHRALGLCAQLASKRGMRLRYLTCLTFDAIAERQTFKTRCGDRGFRSAQRIAWPCRDDESTAGKNRVAGFRRLVVRCSKRTRDTRRYR